MRDPYDAKMNAYALKVGAALDGLPILDAVVVCAGIIKYALRNADDKERERALAIINKFVKAEMKP